MNRLALMVLRNTFKLPRLYVKLRKYAKAPEQYTEQEMYQHIQTIAKAAVNAGNVNLDVYGKENIPNESGFMIYGNHQGMFDILALVSDIDTPVSAVYKKELHDKPLLSEFSKCLKGFPLDREDVRQGLTVIKGVTEEVKKGRNYVIYPEGTRSKNSNNMGEFHHGSFRCAMNAKCPILPVCMIDSFKVLDQKGSRHLNVQMHYLKPIMPEEFAGMKTPQIAEMVKERLQQCIKENEAQYIAK